MTKVLFILAFLVTSIALAGPVKLVECSNSNGNIRYEGIETLVTKDGENQFSYDGSFFLVAPRSDRSSVVGEISRDGSFANEKSFLAIANILVEDEHVTRATIPMLCSYLNYRN